MIKLNDFTDEKVKIAENTYYLEYFVILVIL